MKITFIINEPIRRPSGGYKVIYEYANALYEIGDSVEIIYRCKKQTLFSNYSLPFFIKLFIAQITSYNGPNWFQLNKNIKRKIVAKINDNTISNSDIVIATAVDTAYEVSNLSKNKGKKFYLIQGYETWVYPEEKVKQSYGYEMIKIVVAKWLKELVDNNSKTKSYYIPNGVDKKIYNVTNPIENRKRYSICMMYHNLESKGAGDGIKVLINLKKIYPLLEVHMFGIPDRPKSLPKWIKYTSCATQNEVVEIYNKAAIFLCTSWNEGFGLTGAEAMMCGCALVSTETLGVKEYADEMTSKLVPIKQVKLLVQSCISLIENDHERITMAKLGQKKVTELLDKKCSYEAFINLLHTEGDNK